MHNWKFKKLSVLFLSCVILFILFLVVIFRCGSPEVQNDPVSEENLSFWAETDDLSTGKVNWMGCWLGLDKREKIVREIATEFEFVTGIEVNLKFSQEIIGRENQELLGKYIANMIRTGNIEWDVVRMNYGVYQSVTAELSDSKWGKKYLVNFEEVDGYIETQKPFIREDPTYRNQTGGMLVGPYMDGFYYALYYNADVAQKIGIEIKKQGMTFDDLLGYVKSVYEYNQKNDTNIAAFYEAGDWVTLENLFENLVKSEIGNFHEAKAEFISEKKRTALLKGFRAFEELGKYSPMIDSHNKNVWAETVHIALNGNVLFYVNGTWMYSHWRAIDKEKMRKMIPVEMPVFQEVDYYMGGVKSTWAVLKDAPNCENGIKLLMFCCRPKIAEKWVRYTKSPTGLRGHFTTSDIGSDVFEQFQQIVTTKYGRNIHRTHTAGYLLGKVNSQLNNIIKKKLVELLKGQITAEKAYNQIIRLSQDS